MHPTCMPMLHRCWRHPRNTEVKAHETTAATFTPEPLTQRWCWPSACASCRPIPRTSSLTPSWRHRRLPRYISLWGRGRRDTYLQDDAACSRGRCCRRGRHARQRQLHCTMTVDVAGLVVGASPHETSGPASCKYHLHHATDATDVRFTAA
jgi:hypothetical protein